MRKTLLSIVCGSVLLIGGAALANDTHQAGFTNVSATAGDAMICKFIYHNGTLIRMSKCHTQAEWNNFRMRDQQDITAMQTRSLAVNR